MNFHTFDTDSPSDEVFLDFRDPGDLTYSSGTRKNLTCMCFATSLRQPCKHVQRILHMDRYTNGILVHCLSHMVYPRSLLWMQMEYFLGYSKVIFGNSVDTSAHSGTGKS